MAKPRNIRDSVDTDYFQKVSPTWCAPYLNKCSLFVELRQNLPNCPDALLKTVEGRAGLRASIFQALAQAGRPSSRFCEIWIETIPTEFHEAANELARWSGFPGEERDNWALHPDNAFFRLRERLMMICGKWRGYDWLQLPAAYQRRCDISRAAKGIDEALGVLETLRALTDAEDEVRRHHRTVKSGPHWICGFEWQRLPQRLPDNHVLLGLILAVAFNQQVVNPQLARNDPLPVCLEGGPHCGLPWGALLQFTIAAFGASLDTDVANFQGSVKNIAQKIRRLYRTPSSD